MPNQTTKISRSSLDDSIPYQRLRTNRVDLPDQVAYQIIDLIVAKQLVYGSRLPSLDEFTEYLGVSRTSLREAIKLLEAWGAVKVRHGVGTFIAEPSSHGLTIPFRLTVNLGNRSIRNLMQVREVLEPDIAALAAQNACPDHIVEMENAIDSLEWALTHSKPPNQPDLQFHVTLAKATGNELFFMMIQTVIGLFDELYDIANDIPGTSNRGLAFHQIILRHVKAGDMPLAREAMHAHIKQVWRDIQPKLDLEATNRRVTSD